MVSCGLKNKREVNVSKNNARSGKGHFQMKSREATRAQIHGLIAHRPQHFPLSLFHLEKRFCHIVLKVDRYRSGIMQIH